jgi:hypothetical protein
MIIYTEWMPKRFGGYNLGPLTLIRPKYRNDVGLHAHEEVHRQQFWHNPFMGISYLVSKNMRQGYELAAYKAQLKLAPEGIDKFAWFLSHNYNLDLTQEQAKDLLLQE